jgi:hypothetical protein
MIGKMPGYYRVHSSLEDQAMKRQLSAALILLLCIGLYCSFQCNPAQAQRNGIEQKIITGAMEQWLPAKAFLSTSGGSKTVGSKPAVDI